MLIGIMKNLHAKQVRIERGGLRENYEDDYNETGSGNGAVGSGRDSGIRNPGLAYIDHHRDWA